MTRLSRHVTGMRRFDNSDREETAVGNPEVTKPTKFDGIPGGTWFATYDPGSRSLELHFNRKLQETRQFFDIRLVADDVTGATWVHLDGRNCTIEGITAVGRFTIPVTDFLYSRNSYERGQWVYAHKNIEPLEAWLAAFGDTASAQKLREQFPKVFVPPAPEPQPEPQPAETARKGIFRRRK